MTDDRTIRFAAGSTDVGRRLDAVLAERDEMESRAEAQRLIDVGAVTVGGVARAKRHRLAAGDEVLVALGPAPRPPGALRAEDLGVPVIFEDDHIVVVDKPAGMVTHPSRADHRRWHG